MNNLKKGRETEDCEDTMLQSNAPIIEALPWRKRLAKIKISQLLFDFDE